MDRVGRMTSRQRPRCQFKEATGTWRSTSSGSGPYGLEPTVPLKKPIRSPRTMFAPKKVSYVSVSRTNI
jgi:hypothetical protein